MSYSITLTATTVTSPKFSLGQQARLILTQERGTITQVCANLHGEHQYRLLVDIAFGHLLFRAATESELELAP